MLTAVFAAGMVSALVNPFDTDFIAPAFAIEAMQEEKARTAYWNASNTLTSGSRHTVTVGAKFTGGVWENVPSGTWSSESHLAVLIPDVNGGDQGSGFSTGSNGIIDTNPDPDTWAPTIGGQPYKILTGLTTTDIPSMALYDIRPYDSANKVFVASPCYSADSGTPDSIKLTSTGSPVAALRYAVSENDVVHPQIASTGSLSAGNLPLVAQSTRRYHKLVYTDVRFDGSNNLIGTYYVFQLVTEVWNYAFPFEITKNLATAASIDSRRVYGAPNLEGEIPADANAPNRPITFRPWLYKGGLFVGSMPASSKDQSGSGRIQMTAETSSDSSIKKSLLTLFYKSKPTVSSGDVTVRAWVESGAGSQSMDDVTWDNKWTLPGSGVEVVLFHATTGSSSTPEEDYVNFIMPNACTAIGLASINEGNSTPHWRYFGSEAYQAQFPSTFPANDCQPRVWQVKLNSTSNWMD